VTALCIRQPNCSLSEAELKAHEGLLDGRHRLDALALLELLCAVADALLATTKMSNGERWVYEGNRALVIKLEGIRASPTFKAFSDKNTAMGRFGLKRLFEPARIAPHAVARSPPPS
jgi:hypothetical protein